VKRLFVLVALAALAAQPVAQQAPAGQQAAPAASTPEGTAPPAAAPQEPAPAAPARPSQPSFRAGIDIVSLNVTVTDGGMRYVTDLDETDFSVFEDGVKQDVTFFTRRQQPIALSLLLDSSASMEQHLPTLQTAAGNFVRRLKPNDIAQVIDFDSRVEVRQAFTGNQLELEGAIGQTVAGGSTSLHNAIYIALKELRKVRAVSEEDVRRQALVVFSDGEDTSSLVSFEEVLDLAKRSETAIYAIALRGIDVQTKGFREAEFVMRTLAQETGGRAFFPARIEDLAGVYSQIADELASQYTLGYTSKNARRDGAWRRVVVQVTRPNVTPRAKRGYYAPTAR
jgi:Ca-activated chloride channel family protein